MNARFPPPPEPEAKPQLLGPLPARRVVKKAVILAAGRGRRMGKLTADRPKAALVVGDHALIDWQIAALQAAGVEEIAVVTGHGANALAGRGVTYIHNPNWASGTQVETLLCARDWIGQEPVIVSYGDILYHPCAALALLERPGDIVIAYDADHRWLWKKRFGNWLKDSETFVLGPGQVLAEIGAKPTDIEAVDGQFMGLMLFTPTGLATLARHYRAGDPAEQKRMDFTRLLSELIAASARIDTAANLAPWMEIDGTRDLRLAQQMTEREEVKGIGPQLTFPTDLNSVSIGDVGDEPDAATDDEDKLQPSASVRAANDSAGNGELDFVWDPARLRPYAAIRDYRVQNAFAVQNWGRSGSTFVQSLFDDHPQVLSTPNFYSRRYYIAWAHSIATVPDDRKIDAFLVAFRQWWDTGLVDATAGLHRLGPDRNALAGVRREALEGYLRAAFVAGQAITRRSLFEAAHLAYALARGQVLAKDGLQVLFPVHGEPRGVACAFLEDFPDSRFIHTIREPVSNVASTLQHLSFNDLDIRSDPLQEVLQSLFARRGGRYGRVASVFADRPYLRHLALRDQARLLKLEDLHNDGVGLMSSVAGWLGLSPHLGLTNSSWDGKAWWNRPESGRDSRLGGQPLQRNVASRLSHGDRVKIRLLLRCTPGVRAAYDLETECARPSVLAQAAAVIVPWRQESAARRTEVRCLGALLRVAPVLPMRLVKHLQDAMRRERFRARLFEMASGSIAIRKKLADGHKSGAVHAVLLVSPANGGWRTRALSSHRLDQLEQPDRLSVAFLDEATARRSVKHYAFWIVVLTFGWILAEVGALVRVRVLMARLLLRPEPREPPLQVCPLDRGAAESSPAPAKHGAPVMQTR